MRNTWTWRKIKCIAWSQQKLWQGKRWLNKVCFPKYYTLENPISQCIAPDNNICFMRLCCKVLNTLSFCLTFQPFCLCLKFTNFPFYSLSLSNSPDFVIIILTGKLLLWIWYMLFLIMDPANLCCRLMVPLSILKCHVNFSLVLLTQWIAYNLIVHLV